MAIVALWILGRARDLCLRRDLGVGTVASEKEEGRGRLRLFALRVKSIGMLIWHSAHGWLSCCWLRAPVKVPGRDSWHQSAAGQGLELVEPSPVLELCAPS